jgi:hypothetical protein
LEAELSLSASFRYLEPFGKDLARRRRIPVRKSVYHLLGIPVQVIHTTNKLSVEVQGELMRMRAHADGIDFGVAFVIDVGFQQVSGEHITLEQELIVIF